MTWHEYRSIRRRGFPTESASGSFDGSSVRYSIRFAPRRTTWRSHGCSGLLNPLERPVMEYAEAMTEAPPTVDDELVKKPRDHLDDAQIVELTAIVGLENLRSRMN